MTEKKGWGGRKKERQKKVQLTTPPRVTGPQDCTKKKMMDKLKVEGGKWVAGGRKGKQWWSTTSREKWWSSSSS